MLYMDLEQLYKAQGISDKYVLSMVVTERALQLSHETNLEDGVAKERLISQAIEEARNGKLDFEITPKAASNAE